MARMWSASGDFKYIPTAEPSIEGTSLGTTAVVSDTTNVRSVGGASLKCVGGTTATSFVRTAILSAAEFYTRAWFMAGTLPTSTARIFGHYAAGTTNAFVVWAQLTPSGVIQFYKHPTTPVQIGNDSTETISVDTWFCLQTYYKFDAGNLNRWTLWLNGSVIAEDIDVATVGSASGYVQAGWCTAPGTTASLWLDDLAVNTTTTAYENGRPPMDGRVLIAPISRVVSNVGFTTCQTSNSTTEANLVAAVSNFPPVGHSDTTTDTTAHQIRCITAGNVTPQTIEYECQSYGRAGVGGNVYLEPGAGTYSAFGNTAARTRIAQGFYLNGTLELPRLWLRKVGSPTDTITLSLRSDSSNVPSGTVLQSATYDGSTLIPTAAPIDFIDMPAEPLTPKTKYWYELKRSGANDAANYYEIETCGDIYRDGGESLYNASWGAVTNTVAWHMKLYSTEGVSVVNVIGVIPFHAEGATTGTKTGTYSLSNPTIESTSFTYGLDSGACGTFPSLWKWPSLYTTSLHLANAIIPNAALAARPKISKTDSGTRAALACGLAVHLEWMSVEGMWLQFTKISDSSTWYGKHTARITSVILNNDSELVIDAGDWLMTGALLNEGENFAAATTISVTDTTLRTDYTLVGPAG